MIRLTVNGARREVDVDDRVTLADALRDHLGLTGTHLGCEQGTCGSCTVIVDGDAVRACLMLAVQCDGSEVTTIEGLADEDGLHPIQRAFIAHHALQCGFCTPGFIMLAAAALERNPDMDDQELEEWLSSNLCRCTGYVPIVAAVKAARDEMRPR